MNKVLPGTSREALGIMARHWRSLLKISAIPMAVYVLVTFWQIRSMAAMYRNMGAMIDGDKINPAFMGEYFRSMGLSMLGSLLGACLLVMMFVQTVRFHDSGETRWLITDKAGLTATAYTLLYAIGISLLTMLAYMGVIIVTMLVAIIPIALLADSGTGGIAIGLLAFVGVMAILGFLYWFMFRFMVGLPGVALGHTPDFFKDLWPLSKGETWGLPLRVIVSTIIIYIPILIVMGLTLMPSIKALIANPALKEGNNDPTIMFPILADMMDSMSYAILASIIFMVPFMWYMTLLLAIAFKRFRERQAAMKTQALAK